MASAKFATERLWEFKKGNRDMKTTKTQNGDLFHHYSSYIGEVSIIVKPQFVEKIDEGVGGGYHEITIEFDSLRELVFNYLRDKKISELENTVELDDLEHLLVR